MFYKRSKKVFAENTELDTGLKNLKKFIQTTLVLFIFIGSATIKLYACGVTASVDDSAPTVNQTVVFSATYNQTNGAVWNFGDGANPATGDGTPVSVYYSTPGNKTVNVTAYGNSTGNAYTDQLTVTVSPPACPTITPEITFTDISCYGGADGTITIETVKVDGSPVSDPFYFSVDNGETYTPTAVEAPYTFDELVANEVYEIRVMDSEGCESADTQQ